jgi:Bacterial Ig domain
VSRPTRDAISGQVGVRSFASSPNRRLLLGAATVLGFGLPALLYLWVIHHYGVNVVYGDQWADVKLIGQSYSGSLHLSALWAQHTDNRIFFPNLIVLALSRTTRFNVVAEEYLSASMLMAATALFIWAHKRRTPSRHLIWYCPVAFLMLSLAQSGNTLWGFQMAWYLVLLMLATSLFLLDREPLGSVAFGGAVVAAVVGSFSSLEGLIIWPSGLALLYLRRRPARELGVWAGAGVVTGVVYFLGFNFNATQSPTGGVLHHPVAGLLYFLKTLGDLSANPSPGAAEALFGAVVLGLGAWVLWTYRSPRKTGGGPLGAVLVVYGFLFALMVTIGRTGSPLGDAEARYTVFAVLALVGTYLAVLEPMVSPEKASKQSAAIWAGNDDERASRTPSVRVLTSARIIVVGSLLAVVIAGTVRGIAEARTRHAVDSKVGRVMARINEYPPGIVILVDEFKSAAELRKLAMIAKRHHLSVYGSSDLETYLMQSPIPFRSSPIKVSFLWPAPRSTVHGSIGILVHVSDLFDVRRVQVRLSGAAVSTESLGVATKTSYGWLVHWKTSSVSNGVYSLVSVVADSNGRSRESAPLAVRVQN